MLPLRDVIAPGGPLWWPPAPGWWLLAAAFLVLAGLLVRWLRKRYMRSYARLRKAAMAELHQLQARNDLSDPLFADRVSALLKRAAIVRYREQQPAHLNGTAWLAFLDQSAPGANFSELGREGLLEAQYRADAQVDRAALVQAAKQWIRA